VYGAALCSPIGAAGATIPHAGRVASCAIYRRRPAIIRLRALVPCHRAIGHHRRRIGHTASAPRLRHRWHARGAGCCDAARHGSGTLACLSVFFVAHARRPTAPLRAHCGPPSGRMARSIGRTSARRTGRPTLPRRDTIGAASVDNRGAIGCQSAPHRLRPKCHARGARSLRAGRCAPTVDAAGRTLRGARFDTPKCTKMPCFIGFSHLSRSRISTFQNCDLGHNSKLCLHAVIALR
jgi:hypothetical protein